MNNEYIEKIKLIIIDKHQLFREGLRQLLLNEDTIEVVAVGESANDAIVLSRKYQPNILLIDVNIIKDYEYFDINRLKSYSRDVKIVVLAEQGDYFVEQAIKLGVTGYLLKEMSSESFTEAIETINKGKYWFHPAVTHPIIKEYYQSIQTPNSKVGQKPFNLFTSREYDVLKLLAKGYSNKVIAEKLNITSYTVSSHVRNILRKSKTNDRTHAVIKAIENGWVSVSG